MEGFDHYATAGNADLLAFGYTTSANNDETTSTTIPSFGTGKSLFATNQNRFCKKQLAAAETTVFAQCHFRVDASLEDARSIFKFFDSANVVQFTVGYNSAGQIQVWRGDFATSLGVSAGTFLSIATWAHVAVKVLFSQTVGTVDVQVNGSSVLSLTGLDTVQTANVNCQYVACFTASSNNTFWDNWYIWSDSGAAPWNDFVGERRVETVFPSADTADEDFTPSAGGDSFAMVDEIAPNDDTDYIESSTPGDETLLTCSNLAATSGSCLAVAVASVARKTDVDATEIATGLRSDATLVYGSDIVLSTSYHGANAGNFFLRDLDPDGDVAWTPTTAQAATVAVKNAS